MDRNDTQIAAASQSADRCAVIVPCYNEAARLQRSSFTAFLSANDTVDFLFVNDGSRDGTLALLQSMQAEHPERIRVLDQQPNRGKAEAVRAGLLLAIANPANRVVGFWDADLATPLNAIPSLLEQLTVKPRCEMVFGSRVRLLGHAIHRKPLRHYLGRAFATFVSIVLHLPIYDTQCGAKLFRVTPALKQILSTPFQSRWIFDVEIIARYLALHYLDTALVSESIYESPLPAWEDVAGSKVGPLDFFKAFFELVNIRSTMLKQVRIRPRPHTAPSSHADSPGQ